MRCGQRLLQAAISIPPSMASSSVNQWVIPQTLRPYILQSLVESDVVLIDPKY